MRRIVDVVVRKPGPAACSVVPHPATGRGAYRYICGRRPPLLLQEDLTLRVAICFELEFGLSEAIDYLFAAFCRHC